jgi:hypothetical protein
MKTMQGYPGKEIIVEQQAEGRLGRPHLHDLQVSHDLRDARWATIGSFGLGPFFIARD